MKMNRWLLGPSASLLISASVAAAQQINSRAQDPRPEPAIPAILAAFDTFQVVAIADLHTDQDIKNFVFSLVRHPHFVDVVNDIVIEGANGLLQPLLDRYIAGDDVPMSEAQRLWRDGMNPAGATDFAAQLFQLVRRINQSLPPTKRLRVVDGEGGIEWLTATADEFQRYGSHREEHIAAVLETEIVAKHRKALMFYGASHVRHGVHSPVPGWGNAMEYFEARHPGLTLVVYPYVGGSQRTTCGGPQTINGIPVDTRLASWEVPSVARTKGTWLADLSRADDSKRAMLAAQTGQPLVDSLVLAVDAYLYIGRPELHIASLPSVVQFADTSYLHELWRRQRVIGQARRDPRTDPDQVRNADSSFLVCSAARAKG